MPLSVTSLSVIRTAIICDVICANRAANGNVERSASEVNHENLLKQTEANSMLLSTPSD